MIPASLAAVLERIGALQARFGMGAGPGPGDGVRFEDALRGALEAPAGTGEAESIPSPAGPSAMRALVERVAREEGVDPALAVAVMDAESGGNPRAVSPAGAMGLMQLMPDTARELGVADVFDPEENARAGVRYLREKLREYGGSVPLALAAYNAGSGAVWQHGGIPPYPETRAFVERVVAEAGSLARPAAPAPPVEAGGGPVLPARGGIPADPPSPRGAAGRDAESVGAGVRAASRGRGAAEADRPVPRPSAGPRAPQGGRSADRSADARDAGGLRPDAERILDDARPAPSHESPAPGRPARDGDGGAVPERPLPGAALSGAAGEHASSPPDARPGAVPSPEHTRDGAWLGKRAVGDPSSLRDRADDGSRQGGNAPAPTGPGGSSAHGSEGAPRGDAGASPSRAVIPTPAQAQSARVVVRPPGADGPVSIAVSGASREVSARVAAPSPEAAAALLRGEDALRAALAAHQIGLGSLAVTPVGTGGGHDRGGWGRWGSQPPGGGHSMDPEAADARDAREEDAP